MKSTLWEFVISVYDMLHRVRVANVKGYRDASYKAFITTKVTPKCGGVGEMAHALKLQIVC